MSTAENGAPAVLVTDDLVHVTCARKAARTAFWDGMLVAVTLCGAVLVALPYVLRTRDDEPDA